jgi:hypothetical protein
MIHILLFAFILPHTIQSVIIQPYPHSRNVSTAIISPLNIHRDGLEYVDSDPPESTEYNMPSWVNSFHEGVDQAVHNFKFYICYYKRQLMKRTYDKKTDKCHDIFLRSKLNPAYTKDEDLTYKQKSQASKALQYSLLYLHIGSIYQTPVILDQRAGLCEKYKLRGQFVSTKYYIKFVLFESASEFVLSFKGTTTLVEAFQIDMLMMRKKHYFKDGGRIHAGFHKAFRIMKPELDKVAAILKNEEKPVILNGHSLGGAMAMITAEYFIEHFDIIPKGVYVTGAPRVGNRHYAYKFINTVERKTEVVKVVTADEIHSDPVTDWFGPEFGYHAPGSKEWSLNILCQNNHAKVCQYEYLHEPWKYIESLSRVASNKCGIFREAASRGDSAPGISEIFPAVPMTSFF